MQSLEMRAWVDIDLGALQRNATALATHARTKLLPMIKADAYGLGALPVARTLEPLEPWGYGIATIREGLELRASGITRPLVIFTPLDARELGDAHAAELTPSLFRGDDIAAWRKIGGGPWHLAIDTGMSRAGIRWDAVGELRAALETSPPEGVYTHFHSAERNDESMALQEARLAEALRALPARPPVVHLDNSGAIVRHGPSDAECVRPGLFLYGVGSGEGAAIEPEPVVHFHARVVDLREVHDGETVSYDATFRAMGTRRIATLAAGYADGYPRALSNRGAALIRGARACIAGVVTMDMIMVDVTGLACEVGDVATLIGDAPGFDVGSLARLGDLSPYELLTGLRGRIARVYRPAA